MDDIRAESGTVREWHPERKFGFITPDKAGSDIFVGAHSVTPNEYGVVRLWVGARVMFDVDRAPFRGGRPRALNVKVIPKDGD